ncbi:hypothetical protein LEP1GSC116_1283 [Leptospira interrogans serovar Icterohaemorrhagiae str. Verdun HP]|uniref:Uncharacterized protein n=1 Tax=Leptospira interrogans serovar Icterohaemorrhagiae str. Verdun HP TaxID=1049910 RepID=M6RRV8_LEPIR|nr:hypothetical protein LEP1GSC116_1283 [Leptospira interrogans serovar Icterohaemorrhagiae str. Verdun HP]
MRPNRNVSKENEDRKEKLQIENKLKAKKILFCKARVIIKHPLNVCLLKLC